MQSYSHVTDQKITSDLIKDTWNEAPNSANRCDKFTYCDPNISSKCWLTQLPAKQLIFYCWLNNYHNITKVNPSNGHRTRASDQRASLHDSYNAASLWPWGSLKTTDMRNYNSQKLVCYKLRILTTGDEGFWKHRQNKNSLLINNEHICFSSHFYLQHIEHSNFHKEHGSTVTYMTMGLINGQCS
jgi:hypothetical protein